MKSRKSISRDAHNSPQTSSSVRPGVRSSLHSSDQESDIEEDEATDADYTSPSVQERDRALLEEEEERENLLTVEGSGNTSRKVSGRSLNNRSEVKIDHGERRGKNRRKVRSKKEKYLWKKVEAGASMYEMEEGGGREDTSSLSSSSSAELDRLKYNYPSTLKHRKALRFSIISSAVSIFFILLVSGAYEASRTPSDKPKAALYSNGSSDFAPTTILISLDGFRADFLNRGLTPTLSRFIAEGVSPKYMLPSFPSVTFPNHYTLVTGLYPESHGVVGNSFWDPELDEEFFYTDPARSMQPKWWLGGEPLWVTAEQQNVRTAIHMWPGSEAHITLEPTYLDRYNGTEVLSRKVDRILGLLDKPSSGPDMALEQRPQFIAAYVPVVDADGHLHGPNSSEIRGTIANVDIMLQQLFSGLDERNLTNIVNIVVVSDHGMATTSTNRLIQLDDLIDLNQIEHIDGWPLYGLRPKDPSHLRPLYEQLIAESMKNPNFEVYLRDEDMPERYHFAKNNRIAPLWIIPKTGWAIVHKEDFDVEAGKSAGHVYHPKGLHGYDHEHPLMRAIFIARGPAFPHKPNSRLEAFQNTEVYNIICDSLSIVPKPNNGTLRLPLKPIGLHSDMSDTPDDIPIDLPSDPDSLAIALAADSTDGSKDPSATARPANNTGSTNGNPEDDKALSKLWAWFVAKAEAARIWAANALKAGKEHASSSGQDDESQAP